ncbi:hypothetical protein OIO90_006464 [Microbotryomycetes sp. JL221]|nr:hypothetical protein OIO90_006464 [Microbotryomycetes sp. JL221]
MSRQQNSTVLVYKNLGSRDLLDELRAAFNRVIYYPVDGFQPLTAEDSVPTDEELAATDILFAVRLPLNLVSSDQVPRLKLLQLMVSGIGHVTCTPFWKSIQGRQDFVFANGTGLQSGVVAEHAVAGTLTLLRGMQHSIREACTKRGLSSSSMDGKRELRGASVGILGYGAIGRECARLFTAFGCHVAACTRTGSPSMLSSFQHPLQGDPTGTLPETYYSSSDETSFRQFVEHCDVLVVCLPSEPGNYRLIGEQTLRWMKNDAVVINVGRGDVVHTDALVQALQAGLEPAEASDPALGQLRIGAASLDVTDPEPLPQGHVLFTLPNTIVTPHCGGLSDRYDERGIKLMLDNARALEVGDLRGLQNAL